MKKIMFIVVTTFLLFGCVVEKKPKSSVPDKEYFKDGSYGYKVFCGLDSSYSRCYKKAHDYCPKGINIINHTYSHGVASYGGGGILIPRYYKGIKLKTLVFKCKY